MIISSWNIRGLSHPNKRDAMNRYASRNKVVFMAVLETRLKSMDALVSFTNQRKMESNVGCASNIRIVVLWQESDAEVQVL